MLLHVTSGLRLKSCKNIGVVLGSQVKTSKKEGSGPLGLREKREMCKHKRPVKCLDLSMLHTGDMTEEDESYFKSSKEVQNRSHGGTKTFT